MTYAMFLSLGLTVLLMILSLIFKIAGKLRLTLPLVYFLLIATVLNPWAAAHEKLALGILLVLITLSVISWLFALKNYLSDQSYYKALEEDMRWQIQQARERGIPFDSVYVDSQGNMRYNDTDEVVE